MKAYTWFILSNPLGGYPCHASSLDSAMDSLTQQITSEITGSEKKRVAVVDLTGLDGKANELGKFIAEEILNRLFRAGEVQVVERRFIKKVAVELKLQKSGVIDERSSRKLGKLLGADTLCMGTIAELQRSVKINVRLVDAETGSIFAVASAEIDKKDLPSVWMSGRPEDKRTLSNTNDSTKYNYLQNGSFQQ